MSFLEISNFANTADPHIPDHIVGWFLITAFGEEALRQARVAGALKTDMYFIYVSLNLPKELRDKVDVLLAAGRYYRRLDAFELCFADCREDYLVMAMAMEGVSSPEELQHLYKVRAFAGEYSVPKRVELGSFAIERMDQYDYLRRCGLEGHDLVRAYILGTIAHEVAHRMQKQSPRTLFEPYHTLVDGEINTRLRPRYVSDYVLRHAEVYGTEEHRISGEDFAESIRIYLTEPTYLQFYYPRRFDFIRQSLPFIRAGAVVRAIQSI